MASALIGVFVVGIFILVVVLRIKAVENSCNDDCDQGRKCDCGHDHK